MIAHTTQARDSSGSWKPLKSLNETHIPDIAPGFQRHQAPKAKRDFNISVNQMLKLLQSSIQGINTNTAEEE